MIFFEELFSGVGAARCLEFHVVHQNHKFVLFNTLAWVLLDVWNCTWFTRITNPLFLILSRGCCSMFGITRDSQQSQIRFQCFPKHLETLFTSQIVGAQTRVRCFLYVTMIFNVLRITTARGTRAVVMFSHVCEGFCFEAQIRTGWHIYVLDELFEHHWVCQ